jgi:hypothetical protein
VKNYTMFGFRREAIMSFVLVALPFFARYEANAISQGT